MADGRISAATASNDSRKPELDEETRRTIGLIRHYKERLALETARFEKAADLTEKLQEEGRVLHEHNAVLEGKCEEMKEYTNFVGEKRRRFREAYCGIVDQEDFEIRDTNRMLRDFIVVNREITEILKLTHKAERDAVEQVAREEEEFRDSIREVLVEQRALKQEIGELRKSVEACEEQRRILYDSVRFLERKIEAQQAELALLDDMKENSEIQLIAVREEIKRRCPSYTLPILPDFMDCPILSKELAPKKERQKKVEKTKTAVEPDDASEEEELLPYNDNDSFFTTLDGTVTPRNSAYEDALDNTQEDEDEPEKGPNKVEEEEDVLELVFPDEFPGEASDQAPNDGTPLPLKATVVDLNLDLPTEINSEREVEAPVLYFPHFDVNITQSDCDLTQEDDCHLDES